MILWEEPLCRLFLTGAAAVQVPKEGVLGFHHCGTQALQ